jgi:hypothetical protein
MKGVYIMRNIYDIFEERKFDVFYIEHFSFNELEELDMVIENIERYILNDDYVVMEGFKDKIKDMKGNVKEKIKKFFLTMQKWVQQSIVLINNKYEPVKKHIEKVGKENIIKQLEGKKVKMIELPSISMVKERIPMNIDSLAKQALDINVRNDGSFWYGMCEDVWEDVEKKEITLNKEIIQKHMEYVFEYRDITNILYRKLAGMESRCEGAFESFDKEKQDFVSKALGYLNQIYLNALKLVNKILLISASLFMRVKKEKNDDN